MPNLTLGISSWTTHRLLAPPHGKPELDLLDLPKTVAAHDFPILEICNFHFPSTEEDYLARVRDALQLAGVRLINILVDTGDISVLDPSAREEEVQALVGWIDVAAAIGAENVRVIAGKASASSVALRDSANTLLELAAYGEERNVGISSENWYGLLDTPEDVLALLEMTQANVALKLDFGNWPAPRKYQDLPKIAPYASSSHAKPEMDSSGNPDYQDFDTVLQRIHEAGFTGQHVLVYDGPQDIWPVLAEMRAHVARYAA